MEGITATHMKKFVVHLANAAVRVEENEKKKNSIHSRIEDIRKTSLFKGSTKEQIESQINELKNNVTQVFKTERLLLEDQKKESKIIRQLQERVAELTQALDNSTREKHSSLREKEEELLNIKDHNHTLQLALKEIKEKSPQHEEFIDQVIQKKHLKRELQSKLGMLEQTHKKLASSKKHDPQELKRLETMIKEIKKKLK